MAAPMSRRERRRAAAMSRSTPIRRSICRPARWSAAAVVGGVGAGVTIIVLTPTTDAAIGDGAVVTAGAISGGVATSLGGFAVDAQSVENLFTVGAGLAVGGEAAGALTVYTLVGSTTAEIGAATVTATGNVAVIADNSTSGDLLVGGVALGGASAGGALGVSVLDTTTSASIDGGADVTAYGLSAAQVAYTAGYNGAFQNYVSGASILPAKLTGVSAATGDSEDPLTTSDVANAGEE